MSTQLLLIAALCAGGFLFFVFIALSSMFAPAPSRTEVADLEASTDIAAAQRRGFRTRVQDWLTVRGFRGDPAVAAVPAGFVLLVAVAVLQAIGIPPIAALFVALALSAVVALFVTQSVTLRRRRVFAGQLIGVLEAAASQIETGLVVDRAFEVASRSADEPARGEFERALSAARADNPKKLPAYIAAIGDRYPSPALDMLVTALRLDRAGDGSKISPALREAASLLRRRFELAEETAADLTEAKMNFVIVAVIVAGISLWMIGGYGGGGGESVLSNPIAAAVLAVLVANFLWGVRSGFRILAAARGDL